MGLIDFDRLSLNKDNEMDIEIQYVGTNQYPVLVADNFYSDPDYIRDLALDLHYSLTLQTIYPGLQTSISLPLKEFNTFLYQHIGKLYGLSEKSINDFCTPAWWFSYIKSHKEAHTVEVSHYDPNLFQIVIYLTPPEMCQGGTLFKRHEKYKIDEYVGDEEVITLAYQLMGLQQTKKTEEFPIQDLVVKRLMKMGLFKKYFQLLREGRVKSPNDIQLLFNQGEETYQLWQTQHYIEMKYNRLICFPGFLSHAPSWEKNAWIGESKTKFRLTQNQTVDWPRKLGAKSGS
jgi:hypothetical protein